MGKPAKKPEPVVHVRRRRHRVVKPRSGLGKAWDASLTRAQRRSFPTQGAPK